ncbi:DUF2254 domain-containing protein [Gimesia aquarii]|uniref:DUF2254 domain-containing protein n=1 Tax=Gimesia aquarii TaxID=2527964 RepID=A0A517WX21_9PLAN|nr:DUF2254 domain-containing protein [Gimesia aquarii]QDU09813.1 hypothetical protein V202x_32100 [Gimesia aquarii]
MKARLINIWDSFRSSFWFIPTLMALLAIALAEGTNQIDQLLASSHHTIEFLSTTALAARSTLSSVAGATIALAGVVFSITVVTLSIASSQYGSRLVRNVMTDSIADIVIGQYVGTSLYCLLILRTVRDPDYSSTPFTPHVGTAVGLALGLICMGMLIWFIHHVATAIQAPKLIEAVSKDLNSTIDRLFPERVGEHHEDDVHTNSAPEEILSELRDTHIVIPAALEGYIEGIDGDSLIALATKMNGLIELNCKPGNFITKQQTLARVWSYDSDEKCTENEEMLMTSVNRVIIIGSTRTPRQDISYAALELVEVAVRALSPGINDPFTAMNCIDRLGGALGKLAKRPIPTLIRRDQDSIPRVIVTTADGFPEVLHDSFNLVRQYGASCVAVSLRILESLTGIASHLKRREDIDAIRQQAESLKVVFEKNNIAKTDREDFADRYHQLDEVLNSTLELFSHLSKNHNANNDSNN